MESEKIGITDLFRLKSSSRTYYVTIPPDIIDTYSLLPRDRLKIQIIEVFKEDRPKGEDD